MPVKQSNDTANQHYDEEVDVLVVGSGAGALTAAIVAYEEGAGCVLVIEKSDSYGGTSAMSGGGVWIPNSHYARAQGAQDSSNEALSYMKSVIGEEVSEERMSTYVDKSSEMLSYMAAHSRLQCESVPYSDYYPEKLGGKEGHRTHQPVPMHAKHLGVDFDQLRAPPPQVLVAGKFSMTMTEGRMFLTQAKGWQFVAFMMLVKYFLDIPGRLKGTRSRRLTLGNALIGRLRWSMKDKGIELQLQTPLKELIEERGVVTGAVIERNGKPIRVKANKGVVLGTGGFEHNQAMRDEYLPQPSSIEWSGSQENNTGDGHIAAEKIGAKLALMEHAWWAPVIPVPGWDRPFVIFAERSLPGLVMVNKNGKRFQNEAAPYLESGLAFYEAVSDELPDIPAYLVFDAEFRRKFPLGPIAPGYSMPDKRLGKRLWSVLEIADTLDQLAEQVGIDAEGLKETVAKNNAYAGSGVDPDFHRGDSFYDRYYGDANTQPNPCIAPISKGPFYAIPIYPGDIGTKGGMLTNSHGQVLNPEGKVIAGLYAVGNCAASVMGSKYPGAGATLGPAMTFGYLAALHLAKLDKQQDKKAEKENSEQVSVV